ncbi:secreted small alanine-rich-protein [Zymoseptoria tritici IPO323]|uniref:Secreted small alanine-rich-protein n=1 Tax=Zymoseptoria tritici (strain CBS 115943 / IPO323) TaxID=336722 RepID=F9X8C3_ZYMTI|nr:secreted small alanine-rich-protein [Zymoseptoria tritici IPO323]EGP88473.1 secreted small alanine-rich-protein [Zymoseptoria tritici IPO323]
MAPIFNLLSIAILATTVSAKRRPKLPKNGNNNGESSTAAAVTGCPSSGTSTTYLDNVYCCPGQFYGLAAFAYCGISCSTSVAAATPAPIPVQELQSMLTNALDTPGIPTLNPILPVGGCATTVSLRDDDYRAKVAAATGGSSAAQNTVMAGAAPAAMATPGLALGAVVAVGALLLAV